MRYTYTPGKSSEQAFRRALNSDLGVYSFNQSGNGIGGFLKKMFQQVVPIGKSLLKSGIEAALPHVQNFATKTIEQGASMATKRLSEPKKGPTKKVDYGALS